MVWNWVFIFLFAECWTRRKYFGGIRSEWIQIEVFVSRKFDFLLRPTEKFGEGVGAENANVILFGRKKTTKNKKKELMYFLAEKKEKNKKKS